MYLHGGPHAQKDAPGRPIWASRYRLRWIACRLQALADQAAGQEIAQHRPLTGRSRCLLDMDQRPLSNSSQRWHIAFHPRRVFNIEVDCLSERNLVFVVDDDAMMLKSVARLLRQLGYDSLLFSSAEAFENHSDFG